MKVALFRRRLWCIWILTFLNCAFIHVVEQFCLQPGFMEMWQVFRKDMCHRAMGLCAFVVDGGLWPSFVNCSHSSANKIGRQLFSDGSCKVCFNISFTFEVECWRESLLLPNYRLETWRWIRGGNRVWKRMIFLSSRLRVHMSSEKKANAFLSGI